MGTPGNVREFESSRVRTFETGTGYTCLDRAGVPVPVVADPAQDRRERLHLSRAWSLTGRSVA
jgi:hypothetical protein